MTSGGQLPGPVSRGSTHRVDNRGVGGKEPVLSGAASAQVLMALSAQHTLHSIPDCTFLRVSNRTSVQGGSSHSTQLGSQ